MTTTHTPGRCQGTRWVGYSDSGRCIYPAKMEHDGKEYCGFHDPVKRKERQARRDAERKQKRTIEDRVQDAAPEMLKALRDLVEAHDTSDMLTAIVREANWGKARAIIDEITGVTP